MRAEPERLVKPVRSDLDKAPDGCGVALKEFDARKFGD